MLRTRIRSSLERLASPPYLAWIALGFFISYVAFFLIPVFFSASGMQIYQYVPSIAPGGTDLKQVLSSTKSWLIGASPYFQYNIYPPLTYVLVSPLLLVPLDLRYRLVTLVTVTAYGVLSLAIPLGLRRVKEGWGVLMLVFVTGLFSYGFQFELERGQFNVIAVCLAYLGVWIFHRHPRLRFVAYILLSLSAQLKLYPLIFALAFVDARHDWPRNLRRFLLIGAANVALFFVLGPGVFIEFLTAIVVQSQSPNWVWIGDHSIHSFVALAIGRASQRGWSALLSYQGWIHIAGLAATATCIGLIAWKAYRGRRPGPDPHLLMACAIGASLLPAISNDYELSILAAPTAILLGSLSADTDQPDQTVRAPWLTAGLVLLFSFAYSSTLFSYVQKPATVFIANACPALLIMLSVVTGLSLTRRDAVAASPSAGQGAEPAPSRPADATSSQSPA